MDNQNPALFPFVSINKLDSLPSKSGIYFAIRDGDVIYVGQARNIKRRWESHHRKAQLKDRGGVNIHWLECDSVLLDKLEKIWIDKLRPEINFTERVKFIFIEKVIFVEHPENQENNSMKYTWIALSFIMIGGVISALSMQGREIINPASMFLGFSVFSIGIGIHFYSVALRKK